MTTIIQSILALKSDAQVRVNDEDISTLVWVDGNPTNITKANIEAKMLQLQAEYDAEAQEVLDNKTSATNKLKALGLTDAEIKAL